MKVPFNWLKEFVPLSADPQEVADRLTMRGLEVEGLESISAAFSEVYVGEIVEVEKSPSAEKLSLCRVDTGSEVLPILCGAPNVARGKKVPVAVPGARLTDNSLIESRRIRGMESRGMLCSERELGLSDDHSGIMILPEETRLGEPLDAALQVTDYVLDVNVPPNRGDCQSILGVAREVAAIFEQQVTLPAADLNEEDEEISGAIALAVLDTDACPRYVLRMIRNITIVPAPFWMRSRITKCGMRPINSIVDVTNYVMLELGQPLHAFDYERITDRRIEVRLARDRAVFRTLDGSDRPLEKGDILICDGSGPVALAGVMGGENSEISEQTKHVALESAFFNPLLIRRTSRRMDLRSEASARFEKGIDIENVDYSARRAIRLMQEISGGTVLRGAREVYEKKPSRSISLSLKRTSEVIGTPIKDEEALKALWSMGISIERDGDRLACSIPSFRHDLNEYFDLIEEVARIYGYEKIPATTPVSPLLPVRRSRRDIFIDSSKDYLSAAGFFEVINYGFFDKADIAKFKLQPKDDAEGVDRRASYVSIMNPISKELAVMRTFLAAGVLESLAYNVNRGVRNLRIFEVGKVFFQGSSGELPDESLHLCCALSGKEREYFWRDSLKEYDFFDVKGVIDGLMERFRVGFDVVKTDEPFLEPGKGADILIDGTKVGWMGQLSGEVAQAYEIKEKVLCAELNLDVAMDKGVDGRTYRPIPRFPAVTRDFSFIVEEDIPVSTLIEIIEGVSPLIVSVGVFDVFIKEVKSISFRVVLQSFEDTLTDETINDVQQVIIERLTKVQGVKLRS